MGRMTRRQLRVVIPLKILLCAPVILLPFGTPQTQVVDPEAGTPPKTPTALLRHHPVVVPFVPLRIVLLYSIDGKGPEEFERKHLKTFRGTFNSRTSAAFDVVLPAGKHTLTLSHVHDAPRNMKSRVSFVAKPGHTYELKAERWTKQWSPTIEDVTVENSPQPVAVEVEP